MKRHAGSLGHLVNIASIGTLTAGEFDLQTLYFNLSARERKRLRSMRKASAASAACRASSHGN